MSCHGDLQKPMWYYQTAHYGLGSMLSSFGFFMLPIFALTGFRCILNKRTLLWMCTALSSVGMVFVVAFAMFSLYSNDGLGYSIYLVFAFFINVRITLHSVCISLLFRDVKCFRSAGSACFCASYDDRQYLA